MCGRFTQDSDIPTVAKRFGVAEALVRVDAAPARFNVAPPRQPPPLCVVQVTTSMCQFIHSVSRYRFSLETLTLFLLDKDGVDRAFSRRPLFLLML